MSKVAQAVQQFLEEMQWQWHELAVTRYQTIVNGHKGQWVWTACWEEDDSYFACYSHSPVRVPLRRRPAVAEYLTRANYGLRHGSFEMDYSDGWVSFKTCLTLRTAKPNSDLIKSLAFGNFTIMERYLPGLLAVIYGKQGPKAALREAERPEPEQQPEKEEDDPADDASTRDEPAAETTGTSIRQPIGRGRSSKVQPVVHVDAAQQRARWAAQISQYLKLMDKRMHDEAKGSCFMVIAQHEGHRSGKGRQTGKARKSTARERMVQFCFNDKWFAMDIPNTNISTDEAVRVIQERRGFYREAERPQAGVTTNVAELVQFDPIGKKYIYGDEQEAAEDAAYLLFDVWALPLNSKLLLTASTFDGPSWEKDEVLE